MKQTIMLEASYFPELGVLTAFAGLYLGFFYAAGLKLRRCRDWKSVLLLLLGSCLQLGNLAALITVFNLRHGAGQTVWNALPPSSEARLFLVIELLLALGFLLADGAVLIDNRKAARTLTNDSIAEAIMNLSSGLCFAAADGRIVLSNTMIRNQVYRLTGRPLTDANDAWELLRAAAPQTKDGADSLLLSEGEKTWLFRRKTIEMEGGRYQQISSSDVTERVRLIEALRKVNAALEAQNVRTRGLIAEILVKKSEEEILEMQHRIHHEVGQCIVTARMCLDEGVLASKLGADLPIPPRGAGPSERRGARAGDLQIGGVYALYGAFPGSASPDGAQLSALFVGCARGADECGAPCEGHGGLH